MLIRPIRIFNILTALAASAILFGCGDGSPNLAPVAGFVMIDDAPLVNATVTFEPKSGRPSMGVTNEQGEFELTYSAELEGAIIGPHVVRITRVSAAEEMGMSVPGQDAAAGGETPLAAIYNSNTALAAEVIDDNNFFAFTLESEANSKAAAQGQ